MPGFDRTGPMGAGPRTGWGRGLCGTATGAGGFSRRGLFGGLGRGGLPWGGGRGRCFGGAFRGPLFGAGVPTSAADEADAIRAELRAARETIAAMEARLAELEKKE